MIKLALYQPDIALNVGSAIRLTACLGMDLDIIEPCGFPWNERKIKQSALDYWDHCKPKRYSGWNEYKTQNEDRRIILMTTKASIPYTDFEFQDGDVLLAGRESAGVPEEVHTSVQGRVIIPMKAGLRSFNIINACAMVVGEALRQTGSFED